MTERYNVMAGRTCPLCYRGGSLKAHETDATIVDCAGCGALFRQVDAGTLERVRGYRPEESVCGDCGAKCQYLAPRCSGCESLAQHEARQYGQGGWR